MNVIDNKSLIDDAKSDPYTCLERGTYLVYHDAIHFTQFAISKSDISGSVLMRTTHISHYIYYENKLRVSHH